MTKIYKYKQLLQNSNINDSSKCSCKYCCTITTAITTIITTTTAATTIPTNKDIKSLNNFLCGESFIDGKNCLNSTIVQFNSILIIIQFNHKIQVSWSLDL
jgi:hypothetical protein